MDPATGETARLSSEDDHDGIQAVFQLYPKRFQNRQTVRDLARLVFAGSRRVLAVLVLTVVVGASLSLLVPLATREIYGRILPDANFSQLMLLGLVLVTAEVGSAAFKIIRAFAVLRLVTQIDAVLVPAVWDRMLRLPASFFRRFRVGDLTNRSLAMDWIRETLPADVSGPLLTLVTSTVSLALMLMLSWQLALVALGAQLLLAVVVAWLVRVQVGYRRRLLSVESHLSSLVFSLVQGIGKLRVGGAEGAAYEQWATRFAQQRRWAWKAQATANVQSVVVGIYGLLSQLMIFAFMGYFLREHLDVPSFLAFIAAYGQFQIAVVDVVALLPELLTIAPLYERLRPLLDDEIENSRHPRAGQLRGDVELRGVSFRYDSSGPPVLDDVSITARQGQFVAIVGSSGSGKTTLLRLLLGFEQPLSGTVLYDGQSLANLDAQSVRSQMGVVLQNSSPMAGDLYSNIVGSSALGSEAAWEAARMAGLEDDIRAMPMGLHTLVGERASTFSGGQRQRLMIARALIGKPRILLLDEATSALDNPTQEIVRRSLDRLQATRIVVAHRLSTIRHADLIYLLDRGKVVESGSYDELLKRKGAFTRLAERQLTSSRVGTTVG